jgi:upstream activation factor subunit UAF30
MAKETKTAAAKPAAAAKAAAPKKVNPALMKPMTPSKELGAVVGTKPLPRTEVVSKIWEYIKKNKLQNPKNGREILADDHLKKVFGTDKVTMFEMNKHISKHLS